MLTWIVSSAEYFLLSVISLPLDVSFLFYIQMEIYPLIRFHVFTSLHLTCAENLSGGKYG